jgi:Sulfotransferase domain
MSDALPLLHVGYYKTASSWLQKFLFRPEAGFQPLSEIFALSKLLISPDNDQFNAQAARQSMHWPEQTATGPTLASVLSSEALSGDPVRGNHLMADNAQRLKHVFEQARVLLVVREQRQLIRSLYKTLVLWGVSDSIARLLSEQRSPEDGFCRESLCFDKIAQRYAQLFGQHNVLVLPYELFAAKPRDFIDRIRDFSGLPAIEDSVYEQLPTGQLVNANQPVEHIHLQRLVNRLSLTQARNFQGLFNNNNFEHIMRRIARHKRRTRPTPLNEMLEQRFASRVQSLCNGYYDAGNQRLQSFCPVELASFGYALDCPIDPPQGKI